jgi:hypothetical protein
MKRNRQPIFQLHELSEKCEITSDCLIACIDDNGENWIYAEDTTQLPENLRQEYENCIHNKKIAFQNLQDSGYDEDYVDRPNILLVQDILEELDDLDFSSDQPGEEEYSELDFGDTKNMTREEFDIYLQDKLAFEKPVELLENRTRGKKCLDNLKTVRKFQDPQIIRHAIKHMLQIQEVRFLTILGEGEDGIVFAICNPRIGSQLVVIKYLKSPIRQEHKDLTDDQFEKILEIQSLNVEHEFKMQQLFYEYGLAPKPIALHLKPNIIAMAKIDGTLDQLLQEKLSRESLKHILQGIIGLLLKMCTHGLSHRDLHLGNIGYEYRYPLEMEESLERDAVLEQRTIEFILIDFAYADNKGCEPEIELAQLIRTSFPEFSKNPIAQQNMNYLRKVLIKLYKRNYYVNPEEENDVYYWDLKHRSHIYGLSTDDYKSDYNDVSSASDFDSEED